MTLTTAMAEEFNKGDMYLSLAVQGKDDLIMAFIPMGSMDCRTGQIYLNDEVKKELGRRFDLENPEITSLVPKQGFVDTMSYNFRYNCVFISGLIPDRSYRFSLGNESETTYFIKQISKDSYEIGSMEERQCKTLAQSSLLTGTYLQCFKSNQTFK